LYSSSWICTLGKIPFCTERFCTEYSKYANRDYPDLITCIIESVIYVFEKAQSWFAGTCDFLDIFREPDSSYSYDVELAFIKANISLYEVDALVQLGIEKYQYEERVNKLEELTKAFYDRANGAERRIMQINLQDLARIRHKMLLANKAMTIREAPYTFYLYGDTSVGKTAASDIINNALLRANGFDPDPKFQVSLNLADAFQTEIENWTILIKLDDLANEKAEFEKTSKSQFIIDYVNNNPKHALKADVDSKGKTLIKPKILMATTNVKNVEASVKSNCALSIIRRLNKCITMVVKPEFRKDGSHMLDPAKMVQPINDAWMFTIEEAKPVLGSCMESTPYTWVPCKYNGRPAVNLGMKDLLDFLIQDSKRHFIEQANLLAGVAVVLQTELCPHGTYSQFCNECEIAIDVQALTMSDISAKAMEELKRVHKAWYYIMEFIPFYVFESEGFKWWYNTVLGTTCVVTVVKFYKLIFLLLTIAYILLGMLFSYIFFYNVIGYSLFLVIYKVTTNIGRIHENCKIVANKTMEVLRPAIKNKYYIAAGLGTVASVLFIARQFRKASPVIDFVMSTQGSSYVTPRPDAIQRDNPWVKPILQPVPTTIPVTTTTFDQMEGIVSHALVFAEFRSSQSGQVRRMCMFPIKSNVWLVPYHCLRERSDGDFDIVNIIRSPEGINGNRTCSFHRGSWLRIADTDMCVLSLPSAGDNRDMTEYFPSESRFYCEPVKLIHKDVNCLITTDAFVAEFKHLKFIGGEDRCEYEYDGWQYKMNFNTFSGLCMAPLISKGKFPWILGFHSAGVSGTTNGAGHIVYREQLVDTIEKLFQREVGDARNINVQCHSSGNMVLDFPQFNIKHLGVIHSKSPFNFMEKTGCALLYGAHSAPRRTFRSIVQDSVIAESVCKHFDIPMMYGPPKNINNYIPWHMDASKLTQPQDMNMDILGFAYADLEMHVFKFLDEHPEYKEILSPMSRVATLSGVDGCRGIDAIKLATSAGFPRCKPKKNYVFESEEMYENITRPLDVSEDIWKEIDRLEEILARGERVYFVHRINLKDEPTKLEKEKVRTFAGCSLECLILIRMYFLPIAKMMMDHSDVFECAIGVNAHGPEWTHLTNLMSKFGKNRTIAGDYTDYDTLMWCFIVLLAFGLFISVAEWAGYDKRQIAIMRGIATELSYGLTDFNGEYVMWLIQNFSGHGLTVFINNIANSIYQRYAYYDIWAAIQSNHKDWLDGLQRHLNMDDDQFRHFTMKFMQCPKESMPKPFACNVSLVCYGDDNKMSVSKDINYFNHCTISYSLSRCGIKYTMADKTSESVPFIHSSECGFLKRHSVWSEEFQQYLGPLEIKSLYKTLQSSLVSKVLSRNQQAVEAIDSVQRELFYHGEEVFDEWTNKLNMIIDECDLRGYVRDGHLHTFESLKNEYVRKYLCSPDIKNVDASNSIDEIAKTEVIVLDTQSHSSTSYQGGDKALLFQGKDSYLGMSSPAQGIRPHSSDNHSYYVVNQRIANNISMNKVNSVNTLMGPETHQNVVFRDGTPQWTSAIEGAYDETRKVGMDNSVTLENFFSRPVKVDMPVWTPGSGTPYTFTLDPWTTFYQNKRIANRISNFKLLQSTLKVKFIVNGNMFYYGRLMVDYAPLASYRTADNFSTAVRANIVSASQRSHLYLNPTSSQGGEIHMPFIWPKNALDITLGEWTGMGTLYVREVNPLKHANASTTPVSITAYIWAEDVVLSVPTTVNSLGLTAQSSDEYGSRPISNMASNIAKIAGRLESSPIIGPYAKATSTVANAVGGVAKIFGFSRPAQIEDSVQMKPKLISRMANTDCGDAVVKLTTDSKQELTLDPRVVGVDTGDELDIRRIASIESYLTTFPWAVASTVDTLLWSTLVCPTVSVVNTAYATDVAYQLPACAFASIPFQYWRGTMRYRFQLVASDFHRGRIKIVYDPTRVTGTETNIGFSRIVDLTNERDFTMDVSWGQTQTYLPTKTLAQSINTFGTTAQVGDIQSNGVLNVYIVNDLTTPNSVVNNDIQINVSISMCDDAEFQVMTNRLTPFSYTPQADNGVDVAEEETDNAPVMTSADDKILECAVIDHTNDVYFGESITSFRALLKRYYYLRSYLSTTVGRTNWLMNLFDYPFQRAYIANGLDVVLPATSKANIVNTSLITYLAPAYLAMRGGFRYKYMYNADKITDTSYAWAEREAPTDPPITPSQGVYVPYDTTNISKFAAAQASVYITSAQGVDVTYLRAQPVLEIELPNYNNNRFTIPKNITATTVGSFHPHLNNHSIYTKTDTTAVAYYDAFVSTAEDFNLFLFQGAPPICSKTYTPV
jgi:hypothetical protein